MIPALRLYRYLVALTEILINDLKQEQTQERTILYQLLYDAIYKKDVYYDAAKELFLRSDEHPRKIQLNLAYAAERADLPSLSLSMPTDSPDQSLDSLGVGEDHYFVKTNQANTTDAKFPIFSRHFNAKLDVLVSSSNFMETIILYKVYQGLLIMVLPQLDIDGFVNPKISGSPVQVNPEIIPTNLYTIVLSLMFSYEVKVQSNVARDIITKLCENIDGAAINSDQG